MEVASFRADQNKNQLQGEGGTMTGAYFFAVRDGKRQPVELEFLTADERLHKLSEKPPEFLLNCIDILCDSLQECDKLFTEDQNLLPPEPHPSH